MRQLIGRSRLVECLQDARNRGSRHAMANVLQRSLNTGVAPFRIFRCHPNHEAPNFSEHPRPPWSPAYVRPFPRNQFAMPSKNRLRRDERRHLSQNAAFKSPLVEKERGGSEQGGAQLTARGLAVLQLYRQMEETARESVEELWRQMKKEL